MSYSLDLRQSLIHKSIQQIYWGECECVSVCVCVCVCGGGGGGIHFQSQTGKLNAGNHSELKLHIKYKNKKLWGEMEITKKNILNFM